MADRAHANESHNAPTELKKYSLQPFYEYLAPTGLGRNRSHGETEF